MTSVLRRMSLPLSLVAFAVVVESIFLLGPGTSQTATHLTWAYRFGRIGLPIALVALVVAVLVAFKSWRTSTGRIRRAAMVLAVMLAGTAVWFSSVNVTQWMFSPISGSRYVQLAETDQLDSDDLILGVEMDGQSLIYPIDIIGYHHIVNERLTGEPFVVTY